MFIVKITVKFTVFGTGCAHPSCSAKVISAFYPPWDGKAFGLSNSNILAMVFVDDSSLQADSYSPSKVAWSEDRRPLGAVLHSSNEPTQLLK